MSVDLWQRLRDRPELVAAAAEAGGQPLKVQKRLRKAFEADLVPLALSLAECRRKAAGRFSYADRLWTDSVRLEQATPEAVARHKATRFDAATTDLCSGFGSDAVAIAAGQPVTAVDLDPVCRLFNEWNAEAVGVSVAAKSGDATRHPPDGLIHIDPDRRAAGRRVRRLEQYAPPLDFLQRLTMTADGGAIKVSPASNFGGKFDGCEVELISHGGECREATVWFGRLAGGPPSRATVLTGAGAETIAGDPLDAVAEAAELVEGGYLLDPDPSLVRSGLLDVWCDRHGVKRLDDAEEYLFADRVPDSAMASPFRFVAETANNDRAIRSMLQSHDVGPLEAKTRHVGTDANALQKRFRGDGTERGVLFLARVAGRTRAVLARRCDAAGEPV